MRRYILSRAVQAIITGILISIGIFALLKAAPGDPIDMLVAPEDQAGLNRQLLARQLGLDKPYVVQYTDMLAELLTGRLLAFRDRQPTLLKVAQALPTTLSLVTLSLAVSLTVGMGVALMSATRPYGWVDHSLSLLTLFGMSLPSFWFALALVFVFSDRLRWLPATGIRPPLATGWAPWEVLPHLVLPLTVIALSILPSIVRYARSALIDALAEDFIRTARSKGLPARTVLFHHAIRNALIPVVTIAGLLMPWLLGGTVVVESIFALPGMGSLAVDSAVTRDYPLVFTTTIVSACAVLASNLVVDLMYAVLDPRIRYTIGD
jgi:peptide/nickel transport system permease protein